jgi:Family of unknown function (DUF5681)
MSDDEKVGYKRPPPQTRFRPGVSGNPSGRPKRCPSFRDTLFAQLAEAAPLGGSHQARTNLQALVTTLVEAAISGDVRAQALVLGALTRFGESEDGGAAAVSSDDREILEAYAPPEERAATDGTPVGIETGREQNAGSEAVTVAPADNGLPE